MTIRPRTKRADEKMDMLLELSPRSCRVFVLIALLLAGCATRPLATDYPRTPSYAIAATQDTAFGKALAPAVKAHPGRSGFHLLTTGTDAFLMRIAMVQAAEKSIDLQYFSTRDDTTGKLLLEALSRAAARGVRVRMLLDDWNLDDFKQGAIALNAEPNIEIRVFNPYATRDQSVFSRIGTVFVQFGQFTRRMHNKVLIVDNQTAIMGGRNLGDEYFDAGQDINFRDVDVLAAGPITDKLSKSFDNYWNSDESYPVEVLNLPDPDPEAIADLRDALHWHWKEVLHSPSGKRLRSTPLAQRLRNGQLPLIWATAQLAADSPEKVDQPKKDSDSQPEIRIDQLVSNAQHEFIIITPYFVPLEDGVEWLNSLVRRGVAVRILTNSLASTDMVPAQAGYSHYRAALVKGGVELYELKPSQPKPDAKTMFNGSSQHGLHAKIYMIDRRNLVIGSFNFDPRSIKLNTEQVLVIQSPELSEKVARLFAQITAPASSFRVMLTETGALTWVSEEHGKDVYYDFNPHAGFWRNITTNLFSILPIDDEL